ncbi:unnamed protein product [Diatraea saccharalis]|uniref:C-type lectin domain-containing protein n=1 Tax=Diatraea saccharalis TaxID=40085 RepID=A0A9P0C9U7_9NEOP|nr:unnamed protein product [Diatraea saccharalis]
MFPIEGNQYRFEYEYNEKAGGWLEYHPMPATFTDAFLRCNAEGAVLASPLNLQLQRAMVTLLKTHSDSCGILTGIHATFSKGDYSSIEGVPLSKIPIKWAPNEPDNYDNNEDCIIMVNNGTLADVRCNDTYPYICYKKKTDSTVQTPCGTTDPEYTLDTRTGSCYKFHPVGRTWRRAFMTCMAEGGHLAIINSDIEALVIKNIFAKYPNDKVLSPYKHVASIGYCDWGERGVWYTIHGQSLAEAGFSTFDKGQPNNDKTYDNGSFCGAISRTGLLNDVWCNGALLAFICEKKPESE